MPAWVACCAKMLNNAPWRSLGAPKCVTTRLSVTCDRQRLTPRARPTPHVHLRGYLNQPRNLAFTSSTENRSGSKSFPIQLQVSSYS